MTPDAASPFVHRPVGDLEPAERLARRFAREHGLGDVVLLRHGMNAVFRVDGGILRVGRTSVPPASAIALAQYLDSRGIRVPRPIVATAASHDGLSVTALELVTPSGRAVDWSTIGAMLRRLHALAPDDLPAGYPCPPPTVLDWWDFDELLADTADLVDAEARAGLVAAVESGRDWRRGVLTSPVVCHGDIHPGNVVQSIDGPVLLDWDLVCWAPAAWDHAPMLRVAERWGGAPGEYEALAAGYGRSFRGERFAETVANLRLVAATLMMVRAGRSDPAAADEAERRLRHWRRGPAAPVWRAR